ncbi:MAG: SDR family NAD(P)-dependent oxidoreductase, partial [Leptospiraceae bacterium]|nr:SDR family NAD(P)-dependent oxidoreductase [Leptospiraceae bacterium]
PMLDLQKDYPEAALTFSGSRPLSASEVAETIVNAIGKDVVEIALPTWRAFLAKTASALPQITPLLADTLRRVGLANQEKYQKG